MEDYIQGIVCGHLLVQHGAEAVPSIMAATVKRKRLFVVLSDARLDYYAQDPRPEFSERIAGTYVFESSTQVVQYVEIDPRAPLHSFCLITDKKTEVFVAESARDAQTWVTNLRERLSALGELLTGSLWLRSELDVNHQFQRFMLHTKYTWRPRWFELGRSTIRYCAADLASSSSSFAAPTDRPMKQFALTHESYVSEDAVELFRAVRLTGMATSRGTPTATQLKKMSLPTDGNVSDHASCKDMTLPNRGGLVFPMVVCTGPANLYLAASSERQREDWSTAIRFRIIRLKHHEKKYSDRGLPECDRQVASPPPVPIPVITPPLQAFMDVQLTPGGAWKRHFVEITNARLKVKTSERVLGAAFETQLVPTCHITPRQDKANAFTVNNLVHQVALAPGTLRESKQWSSMLCTIAAGVSAAHCQRVFEEDVRGLLQNSVLHTLQIKADSMAGLVVEKHGKRVFVLSHQATSLSSSLTESGTVPGGSVLVAIEQLGMMYDSCESIWHLLSHKLKSVTKDRTLTLTFRAPMRRRGLIEAKLRTAAGMELLWTPRQVELGDHRLSVYALPEEGIPTDGQQQQQRRVSILDRMVPVITAAAGAKRPTMLWSSSASMRGVQEADEAQGPPLLELSLRHVHVEMLTLEEAGAQHVLRISTRYPQQKTVMCWHAQSSDDLLLWFVLLQLECGVAQNDPGLSVTLSAMPHAKVYALHSLTLNPTAAPVSLTSEDELQQHQTKHYRNCRIAGKRFCDMEQRAHRDSLVWIDKDAGCPSARVVNLGSPLSGKGGTSHADTAHAFVKALNTDERGQVSGHTIMTTLSAVTRHIRRHRRERDVVAVEATIKTLHTQSNTDSLSIEQAVRMLQDSVTDIEVKDAMQKFGSKRILLL